jgi:outer membrane biosynthesis protein TonB
MTAQQKLVAEKAEAGPFVINLCSSTTPMALAQPQAPELKRFNFFVSRRRADGRDRFYLHMGHFMALSEAEEWLNIVREFYPAAWAGDAPGKRLAERAAATAAPAVQPPTIAAVPAPAPAPAPIAPPIAAAPVVVVAPKPVAIATPPPVVVPTLRAASEPTSVAKPAVAPKAAAPVAKPAPVRVSQPAPPAAPPVVNRPAAKSQPAGPGSNVREVLKALDDTGQTRLMPSPVAAKPAEPVALTDTAVLKILETRRGPGQSRSTDSATSGIELLKPDDTATVRALKEAVREDAAVSFAVQLHWSVQPIEIAKVPPLAIFSAYTLYTVDGSRDGRKWYGLRLGFFGDAISAKQVASYVRSEFTSVAVIPVSLQERGRATEGDPKAAPQANRPRKETEKPAEEFKLMDDRTDDIVSPGLIAAQTQMNPKAAAAKPAAKPIARNKPFGKVRANEKRSAKSLEETLEILGASELEIDNGRGEFLNDSGVRHLRIEVQKNSPFSKLLERLSEKMRKA